MEATEVRIGITDGDVSDEVKERARNKIAALEKYSPRPFLSAEVRMARDPDQAEAMWAHGLLDVQGRLVQARMRADQPDECLDLLEERLAQRLRQYNERLQDRRHEPETLPEGQWRHGALPTQRPDHFPRPVEDREVVERMTHARAPSIPEEAAFDLEMLEDDWLLYVDETTGTDAVIRRLPDGSYGVSVVGGAARTNREGSPYEIDLEGAPPEIDLEGAIERLRESDETHVFFVDRETGRGAVVYFRYDGHYGLVRPRNES